MSARTTPTPLRGIVPPLITPLRDRDTLDEEGLDRLIEHVLAGGVHGVFLLGTTGEGPSLSHRLRSEVVRHACRQVAGRVPVLVGITDTAFVESVNLARTAAEAGASAVVAAPPDYFPEGQPELLEYIGHLVSELPLPLFLYNMPGLTKVSYDPETIRQCLCIPGIVGLKDSSGDLAYFETVANMVGERPDWSVLMGPEELLFESMLLGGCGGVCGGANVLPHLFVALYDAVTEGNADTIAALKERVNALGELYRVGQYTSAIIKGIKCALSVMGICDDFMAEPFHRFREGERERVMESLDRLRLPSR